MTTAEEQLEAEARELRQYLYGPATNDAWENMKTNWMADIAWLRTTTKNEKDRRAKEETKKPTANPKGRVVKLDERLTMDDLVKMGITLKLGGMEGPLPDGWYAHPYPLKE